MVSMSSIICMCCGLFQLLNACTVEHCCCCCTTEKDDSDSEASDRSHEEINEEAEVLECLHKNGLVSQVALTEPESSYIWSMQKRKKISNWMQIDIFGDLQPLIYHWEWILYISGYPRKYISSHPLTAYYGKRSSRREIHRNNGSAIPP